VALTDRNGIVVIAFRSERGDEPVMLCPICLAAAQWVEEAYDDEVEGCFAIRLRCASGHSFELTFTRRDDCLHVDMRQSAEMARIEE
jgi:hypothetical protein